MMANLGFGLLALITISSALLVVLKKMQVSGDAGIGNTHAQVERE